MMKNKKVNAIRMSLEGADGKMYQTKMLELLVMYKSRPCLWDRTLHAYSIKKVRLAAYQELLEKYREIYREATMHDLKHRMDTMRNGYLRELKKVMMSKQRSSHPSEYRKPSLWYYDSMSFLEEHVFLNTKTKITSKAESSEGSQTEESQSNGYDDSLMQAVYLEDESDSSNLEEMKQSNHCELSSVAQPQTGSRNYESLCESEDNQPETSSAKKRPKTMSDFDYIGKAFALQMQDLDPLQSAIAHKLISDTIFYAKLGKLTVDSQVVTKFPKNEYLYPTCSDGE